MRVRGFFVWFNTLNRPPLVNRIGFQLWLMLMSIISGLLIILAGVEPTSVNAALSPFFLYLWASTLIIGPLIICYSLFKKNRLQGLILEFWSLIPYGTTLMLYPVMAFAFVGISAIIPALFTGSLGLACLSTALLIRSQLREVDLWKAHSSNT